MGPYDRMNGESGDLRTICREAMSLLQQDMELPPAELENKLAEAERVLVRLRDGVIGHTRREGSPSAWRSALEHVNVAISLVVAVEFPSAGVHAEYLKGAQETLRRAEQALPG